jgi:glucose-6-phosphate 1-dehydrogenase
VSSVNFSFSYQQAFGQEPVDAYETLLQDILEGDTMLFTRSDWVELAWERIMPILIAWESKPPTVFPNYAPGTWGPESADTLLASDGHAWHNESN